MAFTGRRFIDECFQARGTLASVIEDEPKWERVPREGAAPGPELPQKGSETALASHWRLGLALGRRAGAASKGSRHEGAVDCVDS
jgi:hypothetical protein